ncbi:hypothetical protein [Aeromonas veronii]|uniref:hypothetical protein n=1 Tax=Aeromonas veronii TaxID=654 RepID=UPI002416B5C8|nr:hypothetical protein [Aeromonas veronii]WFO49866.1 hypothetical protein L1O00_12590 [Aeromonas veronii]
MDESYNNQRYSMLIQLHSIVQHGRTAANPKNENQPNKKLQQTKLLEKARRDKTNLFPSLFHHVTPHHQNQDNQNRPMKI